MIVIPNSDDPEITPEEEQVFESVVDALTAELSKSIIARGVRSIEFTTYENESGRKVMFEFRPVGVPQVNPDEFPISRGPQGDICRLLNLVRCVRGGVADRAMEGPEGRAMPDRPERRPGGGSNRGERWVARLDRNGDGKVSRSEFDGPSRHFSEFDRNNDGYITADEAPTGPPPR